MELVMTTGAIRCAKLQSNLHHHPAFYKLDDLLSSNQQCQSTEGKGITFNRLAHLKLTWSIPTLSLTTKASYATLRGAAIFQNA